jgi:hypothetical protein
MNWFPDAACYKYDSYKYASFECKDDHKHYDRDDLSAFKIVAEACESERIIYGIFESLV